jgi:hypothetical protein
VYAAFFKGKEEQKEGTLDLPPQITKRYAEKVIYHHHHHHHNYNHNHNHQS